MGKLSLAVVALLLALALTIVLYRPSGQAAPSAFERFASSQTFAPLAKSSPQASAVALSPVQLTNTMPPAVAALANNPATQAEYDARAAPGEFVTPPSVSIEH